MDKDWRVATFLRRRFRRLRRHLKHRRRRRQRRRVDVLPQRRDFFQEFEVGSGVSRASVVAPVGVVEVPQGPHPFGRHVNQVQRRRRVTAGSRHAGELL